MQFWREVQRGLYRVAQTVISCGGTTTEAWRILCVRFLCLVCWPGRTYQPPFFTRYEYRERIALSRFLNVQHVLRSSVNVESKKMGTNLNQLLCWFSILAILYSLLDVYLFVILITAVCSFIGTVNNIVPFFYYLVRKPVQYYYILYIYIVRIEQYLLSWLLLVFGS